MKRTKHIITLATLTSLVGVSAVSAQKTGIVELSKKDANAAIEAAFMKRAEAVKKTIHKEQTKGKITVGKITYDKMTMPYASITYGEKPVGGHSLYISMHGGGGAPARVNDQQWRNQIMLYKPKEGIYIAPRAATNTWDLWHQSHIDPMFDKLIDQMIANHGINPNKVYVTGYSAGGDGTYQLAPRMADRWAGAAMMAGHPGDAKPHNLLNLPYFIQCGDKDTAYKRNEHAKAWGEMLDKLENENPGYYPHKWIVYPNHGHWMKLDCKQAIPWMAKNTRNPWPKKINWYQDDVTGNRFAWLENSKPVKDQFITAEVKGQTITLTTENVPSITLRLSDQLIDLDKPITVVDSKGKELFKGKVERSIKAIEHSLKQRLDKTTVATALLKVNIPIPAPAPAPKKEEKLKEKAAQ